LGGGRRRTQAEDAPGRRYCSSSPVPFHPDRRHGHRVRQVEAARALEHRDAQAPLGRAQFQHVVGQAAGLWPEHQRVAVRVFDLIVSPRAARAESKPARVPETLEARLQARVLPHVGQLAVVEPRAPDSLCIQPESERPDQVQPRARVGAQPDDVAGVGRDLGLEQNDVQWHRIEPFRSPGAAQGVSAMLRVKHLLARKGSDIWSVEADQPVLAAIQIMADRHVGALPVMRGGQLVGVISERDYARKVTLLGRSSAETEVWQIMSSPVVTVGPEDGVRHCMQLMTDRRIRHLPVVDQGGSIIGMISIGDLVRAVIEEQQETIEQLERFIAG
jgi:CBS domain-containing protein